MSADSLPHVRSWRVFNSARLLLVFLIFTCLLLVVCPLVRKVGELLGLWREEFPKGMPADEYARKRNQLRSPRSELTCAPYRAFAWDRTH